MRFFFGIIGFALVISAAVGLPLAWDGSAILYEILDYQFPIFVLSRYAMIPMNWLVLQVSYVTDNIPFLIFTFSSVYLFLTALALALCWLIVRREQRARPLFVWAALSLGLVSLPAQASIMAQAVIAVQMFWVIVMALLIGLPRWTLVLVVPVALFIFFLHPVAVLLFAAAAASALFLGWRQGAPRRALWLGAAAFALLALTAFARFQTLVSPYESEALTFHTLVAQFNAGVRGYVLIAYVLTLVGAGLIFFEPWLARLPFASARRVQLTALVCIGGAGVAMVYWATSPIRWARATDYRTWLFFLTLPFVILALAEAQRSWHAANFSPETFARLEAQRVRIAQGIAIVFLAVLAVQSFVWLNLSTQLRATVTSNAPACIPFETLGWLHGTMLDHWSVTSYSLLLQGRAPTRFVLRGLECERADFEKGIPYAIYAPDKINYRPWTLGWFDLGALEHKLNNRPPNP